MISFNCKPRYNRGTVNYLQFNSKQINRETVGSNSELHALYIWQFYGKTEVINILMVWLYFWSGSARPEFQ